jgi:hypothetical protein
MSAQFAIKSLNCVTHRSKAGGRFGCNGCVFLGTKSIAPMQGDTSEGLLFASKSSDGLRTGISKTMATLPRWDFFKNRQCHDQSSFSRFVYQNSNLSSGTNPILHPSIVPTIII